MLPTNDEEYMATLDDELERFYLYVGDEYGFLKIWDLNILLKQTGIKKVPRFIDTKTAFNPRRKEITDTTSIADQIRMAIIKDETVLPPLMDPALTGQLIREARAHSDVITEVARIKYEDCDCVLTSSKDKLVRVWSVGFDLLGTINLKTDRDDPNWSIPTKQKRIKLLEEID